MTRSVAIVGAGVAGMSAGCYAAMNDYKATIVEMHTLPGGVCTAWKRKGYTFDGCIHWLMGSSPHSRMNKLWRELGVAPGRGFLDSTEYRRYEEGGRALALYTDLDKLLAHLLELAPEDEALIRRLVRDMRKMSALEMPLDSSFASGDLEHDASMLPALNTFRRYSRMPISDLCARMKNPFLKRAFEALFPEQDEPAAAFFMGLAAQDRKNAGYPLGGSLAFAQAMAERFESLGGEIVFGARVTEILVEGAQAVGVRTDDGREVRADYVISAADGHATLFKMLKGRFLTDELKEMYSGGMPLFPPLVQVSLGLRRRIEGSAPGIVFPIDAPIQAGNQAHRLLMVRDLSQDPTLAPPGCSVLTVTLTTDYDSWAALYQDPERYRAEKRRIGEEVIARLEQKWPGITPDIEVVDVASPMTWERYTGNWRAAYEGWSVTVKTMEKSVDAGLPQALPGLDRFFMIGQWTTPGGGIPPAAKDGRDIVARLCRLDGRKFVTTEAPVLSRAPAR